MPRDKQGNPANKKILAEKAVLVQPQVRHEEERETLSVFLSYARSDEKSYTFIAEFKDLLEALVMAKSGRRISAFLDTQNINWGDEWREQLNRSLMGATIFIPLLSANYLDSEMCRNEFNQFYSSARALGVSELVLPILLFESEVFSPTSPDDIVRMATAHQFEVIEDAILSEPGSSNWKRTMARVAGRFVQALSAAEDKLAATEIGAGDPSEEPDDIQGEGFEDLETPGLIELMGNLEAQIQELIESAQELQPSIEAFGQAAAKMNSLPSGNSAKDLQVWGLTAAAALKGPAEHLEAAGERMYNATVNMEVTIGGLMSIARDIEGSDTGLRKMLQAIGDINEVRNDLSGLLSSLRPAEALSVPLRKAIRPARNGLTKVTDSLGMVTKWQQEANVETSR